MNEVFRAGEITIKNKKYDCTFTVKLGNIKAVDDDVGLGLTNMLHSVFWGKKPPHDVYRAGAFLEMVFERIHRDPNSKKILSLSIGKDYGNEGNFRILGAWLNIGSEDAWALEDKTKRLRISQDPGTLLFLKNVQKLLEVEEKASIAREEKERKEDFEKNKENYVDIENEKMNSIFSLEADKKDESNNYKIKRDLENRFTKSLVGEGVEESPEEIMNEVYDLVDNCGSDTAKKVFEKYFKKVHIKNTNVTKKGEIYFDPSVNGVFFDLYKDMHPEANSIHGKYKTLLHESFHAMDYNVQSDLRHLSQRVYQKVKQKDGTEKIMFFADVLRQDVLEYIKKRTPAIEKKFNDIVAECNKEGYVPARYLRHTGFFHYDSREYEFYEENPEINIELNERLIRNKLCVEIEKENDKGNCGELSDIIQGVTADDYCGIVSGGAGHIKTIILMLRRNNGYWNRGSIAREAAANMFSTLIANKEEFNRIKEAFPNAVEFFGKMLGEYVKL